MAYYVVGLDPGGKNAFGWAVVMAEEELRVIASGVCSDMPAAFDCVAKYCSDVVAPKSIGIDAPLFWVPSGDRDADVTVRNLVKKAGGKSQTVLSVNSLCGACLAQGALAALEAKQRWPLIKVTEAHPKALLVVSAEARKWVNGEVGTKPDHIRDAALAAYAAAAHIESKAGWRDLVTAEKKTKCFPLVSDVTYYFPEHVSI